jgi:SAM-dependent methyltransferase
VGQPAGDSSTQPPASWLRQTPPVVLAAAFQTAALPVTALAAWLMPHGGLSFLVVTQGLTAAAMSRLASQPVWWQFIQLAFPLAVMVGLSLHVSPRWYLGAFLLLTGFYWSVHRSRVPLYPSSPHALEAVAGLLPGRKGLRFFDAGCGTGGLLLKLAERRPGAVFEGAEVAPLPYLISRLRLWCKPRENCTVFWRSLWQRDFADCDVVYAYLSPVAMPDLWQKASREMRPGSVLISNSFPIPGVAPHETVRLGDLGRSVLYLWRM